MTGSRRLSGNKLQYLEEKNIQDLGLTLEELEALALDGEELRWSVAECVYMEWTRAKSRSRSYKVGHDFFPLTLE